MIGLLRGAALLVNTDAYEALEDGVSCMAFAVSYVALVMSFVSLAISFVSWMRAVVVLLSSAAFWTDWLVSWLKVAIC